jgi:hypothetical protein
MAGMGLIGFLVTAYFGAGLETAGRALEGAGEGPAAIPAGKVALSTP